MSEQTVSCVSEAEQHDGGLVLQVRRGDNCALRLAKFGHGMAQVLSLASPNATRWLGLHRQAMRNRMLQPNIAEALCGDKAGKEDVAEDEINLVEVPNTFTLLASAASPPASPPLGISPPRPSLVSSLSLFLLCLRSSLTMPTPTAQMLVLTRTMSR